MLPLERNIGPLMLKTIEGNLRKGHNRGYVSAIFVFITLTTLLIFHQIVFNMLTLSVQKSEALEYKNFLSSAPSSQFNTSDSNSCINYNPSTRTITVSCGNSARLTDIYNKLHDNSVLTKQSPIGTWLLSANLIISKGNTFHIDSTDTKWLKINSKVDRSSEPKIGPYIIDVLGSLKIDSVKITSWDPTTNYYAITNGSRTPSGVFIFGAPRPCIVIENNATGTTDITNSEIAYLGYEQGKHKGGSGLGYYGGDGSIIRNNDIHHVYFGLYTSGVGHMIIENNIIRNSGHYGLDPHTGTHDMIIRNNIVYDNNGSGIICSLNCYNILIENNKVYHNTGDGIDFSRNMYNSIVRNNIVSNEPNGMLVSQSHNNQIYNNTILNSGNGFNIIYGSTNNKIYYNTIMNSNSHAIIISNGSSGNTITSNKIISSTTIGLKIFQDSTSRNTFLNNQIVSIDRP
jgi:mannuronan 5-epimerase